MPLTVEVVEPVLVALHVADSVAVDDVVPVHELEAVAVPERVRLVLALPVAHPDGENDGVAELLKVKGDKDGELEKDAFPL